MTTFATRSRFVLPTTAALLLLAAIWPPPPASAGAPLQFEVRLDPALTQAPVDGRLFVFLSQNRREPRFGPRWFSPEPFFGVDVRGIKPGGLRRIDDRADGFPGPLDKLTAGSYQVQALLDHDFYSPHPGTGVGNFYSDVVAVDLDPAASGRVELVLRHTVAAPEFPDSQWVKQVVLPSKLLAEFHDREVLERATVVLPSGYDEHPERRYPTIYAIPGFGGDHIRQARSYAWAAPQVAQGEVAFIRVLLSGQCKWGHHVYANSATNGPRGDCLVREMIPLIDKRFRTIAAPSARFLTGHSSGGWSSLWLQVRYPGTFGGVWSVAPDPVDFRSFSGVNLYTDPPQSFFRDPQGNRRPIAQRGGQPALWTERFSRMDDVLARGGQLRSFEAVFSPRRPDGQPARLYHRTDGQIDPAVARAWRDYDIRLILKENWAELGPKLQGKLHITVGTLDTFYLDQPVRLLAQQLGALESDAQIDFVPDADHTNVLRGNLYGHIRRQMSEAFRRNHPPQAAPAPQASR